MRHLRITLAVCFPYDNSPWGVFTASVTGGQLFDPVCSAMHSNRLSTARGLVCFKLA